MGEVMGAYIALNYALDDNVRYSRDNKNLYFEGTNHRYPYYSCVPYSTTNYNYKEKYQHSPSTNKKFELDTEEVEKVLTEDKKDIDKEKLKEVMETYLASEKEKYELNNKIAIDTKANYHNKLENLEEEFEEKNNEIIKKNKRYKRNMWFAIAAAILSPIILTLAWI